MRYLRLGIILFVLSPVAFIFQNCGKGFETSSVLDLSSKSVLTLNTNLAEIYNTRDVRVIFSNATDTISSSSAANNANLKYFCQIDDLAEVECSRKSFLMEGLTDGDHSLQIYSVSPYGKISTKESFVFRVDATLPKVTVTEAPMAQSGNPDSVIKFVATDNLTGVEKIECSVNNADFQPCTSPLALTALPDLQYNVRIRALDKATNYSEIVTASWLVDTKAPVLTYTARPLEITNLKTATIAFTGTDNGVSMVKFECAVDNGTFAACTSPVNLTALIDGTHTFSVRGTDDLAHTSGALTISWIVDTTPPQLPVITANVPNPTNLKDISLAFVSLDRNGSGIAKYVCSRDGGPTADCTSPVAYTNLNDGSHMFTVQSFDRAGNISGVQTFNWFIDTVAPLNPTVSTISVFPTSFNQVTFNFTSSDAATGLANLTCGLDSDAPAICTSPLKLPTLSVGNHTFAVTATDRAGNMSTTTLAFSILAEKAPSEYHGTTVHFFTKAAPAFPETGLMNIDQFKKAIDEMQGKSNVVRVSIWGYEFYKNEVQWDYKADLPQFKITRDKALILPNVAIYREALTYAQSKNIKVIAYFLFDNRFKDMTPGKEQIMTQQDLDFFYMTSKGVYDEIGDLVDVWQSMNESNWTHWANHKFVHNDGKYAYAADIAKPNTLYNPTYLANVKSLLITGRYALEDWKAEQKTPHSALVKFTTNTGGPVATTRNAPHFIEYLDTMSGTFDYKGKIMNIVDFVSIDPYPDNNMDESKWADYKTAMQAMKARYQNILVMEYGWFSATGATPSPTQEAIQTEYTDRMNRILYNEVGIKNLIHFSYYDYLPIFSGVDSNGQHFGLTRVNADGTHSDKPSLNVMNTFFSSIFANTKL